MFNLKRKIKQITSSPEKIIKEIHDSFDGATEKLLIEANEILENKYDISKGQRLKKIGFRMAKDAAIADEWNKKISNSRFIAEKIQYYQINYPNNKFITGELVKTICKKYSLVLGDASYYIGEVPEKNILEMEKFKLNEEDMTKYECGYFKYRGYGYYGASWKEEEGASWGYVVDNGRNGAFFNSCDNDKKNHYQRPELMICAPMNEFDERFVRRSADGFKLELNIPDPIVLQPVNGGYLIVTKWGLEASDENIVNEKMN